MAKKKEKPGLTRAQARAYLDGNSNRCPHCDDDNLSGSALQVNGPQGWSDVVCLSCRRTWRDLYYLQRIVETYDGGKLGVSFDRPAPAVLVEVEPDRIIYNAYGEVTVVAIDWEKVENEDNPELIKRLIAAVEALPLQCDPGGSALRELRDKLIALEGDDDEH